MGRGILHVPVSEPSSSGPRRSPIDSVLVFGCGASAPSSPFARSLCRQPGLAAPGADRRCWPCLGETLGPHRYRGIALARACASPPLSQGFPWYGTSRAPSGASVGTGFVLEPLRGCVPGRDWVKAPSALPGGRAERRGRPSGLPMKLARQVSFQNCCLAEVCSPPSALRQ